jgi:hypothetical protein
MSRTAVIGFTEPFVGTRKFYIGDPVARTATGSGTSSSSATEVLVAIRTATGSGSGTSSTIRVVIKFRTATGSGTGAGSADRVVVKLRTATGSGVGSGAGVDLVVNIRTATGSGSGTAEVVGVRVAFRTATSTGTGTSAATWIKSHILRLPAIDEYPAGLFAMPDVANRLRSYDRSGRRAQNLYKLTNGTYTTTEQRNEGQVEKVYLGSHSNFLTDTEVSELTAAGYGSYIT